MDQGIVSMKKWMIIGLCLLVGWQAALPVAAKAPIETLLITGQNNHNWPVSHQVLKRILESSGLFTVDVAQTPPAGGDMSLFSPDFDAYRLVVLDYNGDAWPEAVRERFENYVKNGGGVVVYHAANNAFPDWKAYNEITALGGWEGRNEKSGDWVYWKDGALVRDSGAGIGGSHGQQHSYVLNRRNADHPVTRGLPERWLHAQDELYDRMRGPGNIRDVLFTAYSDPATGGSGREELLIFTVDYGKGRIFHDMLGHAGPSPEESPALQCTGFQVLLLRGAEWAATGKVRQPVPDDFPTATTLSYRKNYVEE